MRKLIAIIFIFFSLSGCDLIFQAPQDFEYTITDFSPSPGAEDITIFPRISFTEENSRGMMRRLYFGTENPPNLFNSAEFIFTDNRNGYVNLKFLENNTKYYWRIVNIYYHEEGDSWTYDTGIQTFSTCDKDGITPIINIINPVDNSAYSDILEINVELIDDNAIGYSQLIINNTDTLAVFHNEDICLYDLDTFNLENEINTLTVQSWDKGGEYSNEEISFHVLDQIRIRSGIYYTEVHFTSNNIDSYLNNRDALTLSSEQFTNNQMYTWTTKGISINDDLFGELISVNGSLSYDDFFTEIWLEQPDNYVYIVLRDNTSDYNNFIIRGNLIESEDVTSIIYEEIFSKDDYSRSANFYYLGYFDVTKINEIEFSGCFDSTYTPIETKYVTNEEISEANVGLVLTLDGTK